MRARRPRRLASALVGCVLLAAAAYAEGPAPAAAAQNYLLHCQGCHGAEGLGVAHKVPSLADSIPRLVTLDEGRDFLMRVPGAASSRLSDAALAGVLNWLVVRFAGVDALQREFTAEEVGAARRRPLAAVHRTRLEIAARLAAAGLPPPADY
jgi:mono/diheme cytochrome c family protein